MATLNLHHSKKADMEFNKVYEGKYEYDGKEWDIMDWCFSQVKGTT